MKSFSLPSKQYSNRNIKICNSIANEGTHNQDAPEAVTTYVTDFDSSSNSLTELVQSNKNHLVIAPKENEWKPYSSINSDGNEFQFEVEASDDVHDSTSRCSGTTSICYGINLCRSTNNICDDSYSVSYPPAESIYLKKLRDDLHRLPEDEGFEQFVEVPVEGFGAALLAGYGWYKGRGIGKNAKEDVKFVEYKPRVGREGLGFISDQKGDGDNPNVTDISNRIGKQVSRFSAGKEVRIIGGKHIGLKGKVAELIPGRDMLLLKLSSNNEEVKVHVSDITELGSVEEENRLKKSKEDLKTKQPHKDGAGKNDGKDKETYDSRSGTEQRIESKGSRESRRSDRIDDAKCNTVKRTQVSWLRSHIRVKIVSKEFKGGKLHLKKGEVVDVVGPTTCDIAMDDNEELIQGVDQDILETALPRTGGPVLVLFGNHKGVYGRLVERNTEKNTGLVQDADTGEFLNVRLEEIVEYIGDPSCIGY